MPTISIENPEEPVNIIPNWDCEIASSYYWGWSPTDSSINKSPTKSLTKGTMGFYQVTETKKVSIDGTKNYDFSFWVASSNYFKSNGTSSPASMVLRTYDSSDTQLSSVTYFVNDGYEGFNTSGVYEGMVFHEIENIDIPDNASTFLLRFNIDRPATGQIWWDDFYLGEVYTAPKGILLIVQ